ncbi:MAG: tRNA (adenosine(37)-N6)-dimethylallyltransferase MiaA [Pseudomonadales bacterium]|nr:tRNA (adenosine(37)-N6)-dimethylallyltransferase MiaA [Pseudomonadales bacterium]
MNSTLKLKPNLIVVLGATASGKTKLAVQLAKRLSGEIISADSRQVYRGLDIGSGKDLGEYDDVPYHLIDVVDPGYEFSVYDYQRRFIDVFTSLTANNVLPILAGGTGLYLDAVLKGYQFVAAPENAELRVELGNLTSEDLVDRLLELQPQQHNTTDTENRERLVRAIEVALAQKAAAVDSEAYPTINPLIIGIKWERKRLRERITLRLKQRLENGLIEETQQLHDSGLSWEVLDFFGLEYRFVGQYLQDKINRNDLFQKLNAEIHRFAKKQDTWFRRMERKGAVIHWVEGEGVEEAEGEGDGVALKQVLQLLDDC